jgi:hypothetical protein
MDFLTFTEMFGSGSMTGLESIPTSKEKILRDLKSASIVSFEVDLGAIQRNIYARLCGVMLCLQVPIITLVSGVPLKNE